MAEGLYNKGGGMRQFGMLNRLGQRYKMHEFLCSTQRNITQNYFYYHLHFFPPFKPTRCARSNRQWIAGEEALGSDRCSIRPPYFFCLRPLSLSRTRNHESYRWSRLSITWAAPSQVGKFPRLDSRINELREGWKKGTWKELLKLSSVTVVTAFV